MIRAGLFLAVVFGACGPQWVAPAEAPPPEPVAAPGPADSLHVILPAPPPGRAWVLVGRNDMGFAVCDPVLGRVSYVRTDLVGGPEQEQVVDHENDHVALMHLFPDCGAFWRWFAEDPDSRRREVEARAYCASVRADVRIGRYTYPQALLLYANKLADQTRGTTTFIALREMLRFCPPSPEVAP